MPPKKPVVIGVIEYPSVADAARAIGIEPKALSARMVRARDGAFDSRCKPVCIDGVNYPSQSEAARQLQVSPAAISRRLKRRAARGLLATPPPIAEPNLPRVKVAGIPREISQSVMRPAEFAAEQLLPIMHPGWSPAEDHRLLAARNCGEGFAQIAIDLVRPCITVTQRFHRLRVIPQIETLLQDYGLSSCPYPMPGAEA